MPSTLKRQPAHIIGSVLPDKIKCCLICQLLIF